MIKVNSISMEEIDQMVLQLTELQRSHSDRVPMKELARMALQLANEKDIIKLMGKGIMLIEELKEKGHDVNTHPLSQYIALLLKNKTCPNPDYSMRRCEIILQNLAEI